jgi:AraC-like DNA-binding protein
MDTPMSPAPHLEYLAPSSDMARIVHTLFVIRAGPGETADMMPAYSAQLFSFVQGRGSMHYPERDIGQSSDVTLNAPMLRAAPMIFDGPVVNVGASFTPLGWAAFSGLAADKVHDCAFPADDLVPQEHLATLTAELARCRAGEVSPEAYGRAVEDMIRKACQASGRAPNPDHERLLAAIEQWLESAFSPPVQALYDSLDLGQRQVQRLCKRYYGVPPAQLLKRYRAIRAAMLLAREELSAELRDEVVSAYFDQAHLIHDIRRYTGRTPRSLLKEPLAQELLDPDGHGQTGKKLREE